MNAPANATAMTFWLRVIFIVDFPQKVSFSVWSAAIDRDFQQLTFEYVGQVAAPFARPVTAEGVGIVRQAGNDLTLVGLSLADERSYKNSF